MTANARGETRACRPTTIDRLLLAAYDEFASKGYEAASIDGISRRAGAGRMTFYRHFSGKEAIFYELVRRDWAHTQVELGFLDTDARDPQLVLLDAATRIHDLYSSQERRNLLRMTISAARRLPQVTREVFSNQTATQPLKRYFEKLIQNHVLARRDPEMLARMFFRIVIEIHKLLLLDDPSEEAGLNAHAVSLPECVEIFLNGACKRPVRRKARIASANSLSIDRDLDHHG